MESLGNRIRYLRQQQHLSMAELAEAIGTSSGKVSDWENERTRPSVKFLVNLSDYFGVSLDWLLKGHGPPVVREPGPVYDENSEGFIELWGLYRRLPEGDRQEVLNYCRFRDWLRQKK